MYGISVIVKIAEPGTSETLIHVKELEVNSFGNVKSWRFVREGGDQELYFRNIILTKQIWIQ